MKSKLSELIYPLCPEMALCSLLLQTSNVDIFLLMDFILILIFFFFKEQSMLQLLCTVNVQCY